jgi:hypothetical protein
MEEHMNVSSWILLSSAIIAVVSWLVRDKFRVWSNLLVAIAVAGAFAALVMKALSLGVRLDANSNKLLSELTMEGESHVYRAKYKDPQSFHDYVFVYDPSEVYFDSYGVNYTRRDGRRNSGLQTSKGDAFPGNAAKRMISLPAAANAPSRYNQPSSSRAKNFVSGITVQFFYKRGERSEEQHESMLAKFEALATKGEFLVRRGGRYQPVVRSRGRP